MVDNVIHIGSRFSTLYTEAKSLFLAGHNKDEVLDNITQINITKCRPPLTQMELIHLVNNTYSQRTFFN